MKTCHVIGLMAHVICIAFSNFKFEIQGTGENVSVVLQGCYVVGSTIASRTHSLSVRQ